MVTCKSTHMVVLRTKHIHSQNAETILKNVWLQIPMEEKLHGAILSMSVCCSLFKHNFICIGYAFLLRSIEIQILKITCFSQKYIGQTLYKCTCDVAKYKFLLHKLFKVTVNLWNFFLNIKLVWLLSKKKRKAPWW